MGTYVKAFGAVCFAVAFGWLAHTPETTEPPFEQLVAWIRNQDRGAGPGFVHEGIVYKKLPKYGGSLVYEGSTPVEAGDLLFRIPLLSLLLEDYVYSEVNTIPEEKMEISDVPVNYAGFIMQEQSKGEASLWQPYFATLPSTMFLPYQMNADKLAKLNETHPDFVQRSQSHREFLHQRYNDVVVPNFGEYISNLNFEWFERTMFFLQSRSFTVFVFQDENEEWHEHFALIPLVDLLNTIHPTSFINIECSTDESSQFFSCTATQPIQQGDQLFLEYGAAMKNRGEVNTFLLRNYGFSFAPTKNETVLSDEDIAIHQVMQSLVED